MFFTFFLLCQVPTIKLTFSFLTFSRNYILYYTISWSEEPAWHHLQLICFITALPCTVLSQHFRLITITVIDKSNSTTISCIYTYDTTHVNTYFTLQVILSYSICTFFSWNGALYTMVYANNSYGINKFVICIATLINWMILNI